MIRFFILPIKGLMIFPQWIIFIFCQMHALKQIEINSVAKLNTSASDNCRGSFFNAVVDP